MSSKLFFKRVLQCLFELLVFFPLLLGAAIYIHPSLEIGLYFLYLVLLCIFGIIVRGVLYISNRWAQLLMGIVSICLIVYFSEITFLKRMIFFALALLSYSRGITYMEADWETMFPSQMWWIGLILYMLAGVIYGQVEILKPYLPYVAVCGFFAGYTKFYDVKL